MLWEAWQYLSTPAPKLARKMGYLYEAIAMAARSERCRFAWQPHYQQCQQAIQQAAEQTKAKGTVLIFGAGSLRDIPLTYLAQAFQRVILVDLVFLKSARAMVAPFPQVELVEADVTESLESLYHGVLQVSQPQAWLEQPIDLVVSLNLITQLPLIPIRRLAQVFQVSELVADQVGRDLIQAHLDYLQRFGCPVCLIADRIDREFNAQGELLDEFDPWWGVHFPAVEESWQWEVVPLIESGRAKKRQVNQVGVSYFNI